MGRKSLTWIKLIMICCIVLIVLGFNDTSTVVDQFMSFPRERENKRTTMVLNRSPEQTYLHIYC